MLKRVDYLGETDRQAGFKLNAHNSGWKRWWWVGKIKQEMTDNVAKNGRMDTQHEWVNRTQASGKTFIAFIRLFTTNFSVILQSILRVSVAVGVSARIA